MAYERSIQRYKRWYTALLRFYPDSYRERMGESMEQTFNDLLRERVEENQGLVSFVLWTFVDTLGGISKENIQNMKSSKKTEIVIVVAALAVLGGVWALNGYEDTWLYIAAGVIAIPASWFFFGKKKD